MNAAAGVPPRAPVALAEARRLLASGTAVVLPHPAPLTHVVAATTASAVNRAKDRPPQQPVAAWAHHRDTLDALTPLWDLAPAHRTTALRLLSEENLTVLLPLRARTTPAPWLAATVKDGWMLLFGARWTPLLPLLDDHPVLYVSSANLTGRPSAADTGEALAMFPPGTPVLHLPDGGGPHAEPASGVRGATTTVRLVPDRGMHLHQHGAQDRFHGRADGCLRHLRALHGDAD
ncbi:hypothetical protein ACIOG8_16115 [Streptomyces erythrochromogenes]|uniref:hypothetical protein n=1 Tax=Streptomyces erythrochromogenes TaxID=285574 RepID=UPI0038006EC4